MDSSRIYVLGRRAWCFAASFSGAALGYLTGGPIGAAAGPALLLLPAPVVFDSSRIWWPEAVALARGDAATTRRELRFSAVMTGIGMAAGIAVALRIRGTA